MRTFVECVFFLLCSTVLVSGVSLTSNEGDHKFYTSGSNGQPGTIGTEFVFNFPQPFVNNYSPTVIISTSSIYSVSVNVSVPGLGFYSQTTVDRTQHAEVILPYHTYLDLVNYAQDKTVVVTSDGDVSVHGMTSYGYRSDGFMALPTCTLGKKYLILTYGPYSISSPSEVSISAIKDATNIKFILPDASQSFDVTLNKDQSYQVFDGYRSDLTGSIVEADKPIAVMAGVELAAIDPEDNYGNGLLEQLPSIDSFGTQFVLAPFKGRLSGYIYRVICPTTVTISVNGANIALNAGQMYEGDISSDSITMIIADKPILVTQYMKDYYNDYQGGSGMVIVPPVEKFSGNVTFPVYDSPYNPNTYLNVISNCSIGDNILFNNMEYVSNFDTISNNGMCVFRSDVTSGTHSVTHVDPSATFAVVVYGYYSGYIGFIYLAGYDAIPDGQIRLVEGSNKHEGRVEVYYHGDWGTVCDDEWDRYDGNVVCKQLGYDYASNVYGSEYFGAGSGPILLDDVGCVGNEPTLSDCFHRGWGVHDCEHKEDAGVRCAYYFTDGQVRLVEGSGIHEGRVEVYHDGVWGTVCDDSWDRYDGDVVCKQLGYNHASNVYGIAYFGAGTGPILLDDVGCVGNEPTLSDCSHRGWGVNDCGHSEDAGVRCTNSLPDQQVRLVEGSNKHEGRVEVYHHGDWGTVCDDKWDISDGDVVCKQLGYNYASNVYGNAYFGVGSGLILLDDVGCVGNEPTLSDCSHRGWGVHDCGHKEDAGVRCAD